MRIWEYLSRSEVKGLRCCAEHCNLEQFLGTFHQLSWIGLNRIKMNYQNFFRPVAHYSTQHTKPFIITIIIIIIIIITVRLCECVRARSLIIHPKFPLWQPHKHVTAWKYSTGQLRARAALPLIPGVRPVRDRGPESVDTLCLIQKGLLMSGIERRFPSRPARHLFAKSATLYGIHYTPQQLTNLYAIFRSHMDPWPVTQ